MPYKDAEARKAAQRRYWRRKALKTGGFLKGDSIPHSIPVEEEHSIPPRIGGGFIMSSENPQLIHTDEGDWLAWPDHAESFLQQPIIRAKDRRKASWLILAS